MKSQLREGPPINVPCKDHKQKCVFVCLHKTCAQSFKIGCPKCRKDHGQHPNRLITLHDFHAMLSKPIRYLQNLTAFKLMNLKKKIEYIRNFRTSILQKQIELMQSNGKIKSTITSILEQHYKIRAVVSHIDTQSLLQNSGDYSSHLNKCKEFMAFNPVKGDLVFNNDVIKGSRVTLEKHLKRSHQLTDSIREFLVKIIQVLLANCAHQEDDDDIQFQNQGDNPTNFNIFIKTRTDASQNPNIKNKLEHEEFLQMFDQQKNVLNQQVDILEKQLHFKVNILNKIKSSSQIVKDINCPDIIEPQMDLNLERVQSERLQRPGSQKMRSTDDSQMQKQKINNEILELKEDYQTILGNKEEYILELKQMCSSLEEKIDQLQLESKKKETQLIDIKEYEENKKMLKDYEKKNMNFKEKLEQMSEKWKKEKDNLLAKQTQIKSIISKLQKSKDLNQKLKFDKEEEISKKQNEIKSLKNRIQTIERRVNTKSPQNNRREIQKMTKNQQDLKKQIQKIQQEVKKKDNQITKQKKKSSQIQKLVQKMRQNNEQSQKQLIQWRNQHQQRQKMLRDELEYSHKEIDSLHGQMTEAKKQLRELEAKLNEKAQNRQQTMQKSQLIVNQQKQLSQKQAIIKQQVVKIKQKEQELEQQLNISKQKYQQFIKQQEKIFKQKQEQLIQVQTRITYENQQKLLQIQAKIVKENEHQLKQKQNQKQQIEQNYKQKIKKMQEVQRKQMRQSKKESSSRTTQDENKKINEMKEMLEISIRKNQDLKDRNYQLEKDMQIVKEQNSNSQKTNGRRAFCQERSTRNQTYQQQQYVTSNLQTVNSEIIEPPSSPTFKKKGIQNTVKSKKHFGNKQDKRQAYLQIKSIFKMVSQDVGILQDRLKQNTVIEKVYLKELQRKRNENKTLKKEIQSIKLYGNNFKSNDIGRAISPSNKGIDKISHNSPLNLHPMAETQAGMNKKYPKGAK